MEDEEAKKELLENAAKKTKLQTDAGSSENNEVMNIEEESIPNEETKTLPVNESLKMSDNISQPNSTTDALEDA